MRLIEHSAAIFQHVADSLDELISGRAVITIRLAEARNRLPLNSSGCICLYLTIGIHATA
ncbi:hypothetical protein [Paraburkholderia sp. BL6665CI2N2]|uniref:hypothetical protein n=1 Tax=Paraburkholderia sp. BL6665CI2N2 TaxID=1938806 RepID=UPI00106527FD|nr:hypothetical protein [Paraburkholderia sp. BL6665CI2N2]